MPGIQYTGHIFDIVTLLVSFLGIVATRKSKKKKKSNQEKQIKGKEKKKKILEFKCTMTSGFNISCSIRMVLETTINNSTFKFAVYNFIKTAIRYFLALTQETQCLFTFREIHSNKQVKQNQSTLT